MGSDLRYVVRRLRGSPGFTLVALLSLAIGIGANAAMFGVVRTLLLMPMPVEAPEELALVAWRSSADLSISQTGSASYTDDSGASYRTNFSHPIYTSLRAAAPDDVELFAFAFLRGVSVALDGQPASLAGGVLAGEGYFETLGVPMALGRPLMPADHRVGAPLSVVLSHAFWMRAFGGDPAILGRTVRVNGNPADIVGITGEGFGGLSKGGFFPVTDITVALSAQPRVYPRMSSDDLFSSDDNFWLRLMARVPDGAAEVTTERLLSALRTTPSPVSEAGAEALDLMLFPGSQGAQPVDAETTRLLHFLLAIVGLVLLIACVNLATLMLARGASRQRELAVRRALGGGRGRIVRLMLTESLVLAIVGTLAGLLLASSTRGLLSGLLTASLGAGSMGDLEMDVLLDPVVVMGSILLGGGATVLFGLLPALRLSSVDPAEWLRHRPGAGSSASRLTLGRALISLQIVVSVPLVVSAMLFLRTVANLGAVELGFDPTGVVAFKVDPGFTQLPAEEYSDLYRGLITRLDEIPEVRSVTLMENVLMSGIVSNGSATVDGESFMLYRNAVGPQLIETIGMRLLDGRMPGLQDGPGAPRVGVVNETAVTTLFDGRGAIGRVIRAGGVDVEVVGIVNDTPYRSRRAGVPPTLYESALQRSGYGGHNVVLRVDGPTASLEPVIRSAVAEVNRDVPVPEIRSQSALMAQTSAKERVFTQLLSVFGGFALLLASIGLHGVTSYSVTRRTGEIGVRVALGARPRQILRLVLGQVLTLAVIGLVAGVPLSIAVGPVVGSLLFGVVPSDPVSVGSAAVVMLSVAVVAGLMPALRAARVDPQTALRTE